MPNLPKWFKYKSILNISSNIHNVNVMATNPNIHVLNESVKCYYVYILFDQTTKYNVLGIDCPTFFETTFIKYTFINY